MRFQEIVNDGFICMLLWMHVLFQIFVTYSMMFAIFFQLRIVCCWFEIFQCYHGWHPFHDGMFFCCMYFDYVVWIMCLMWFNLCDVYNAFYLCLLRLIMHNVSCMHAWDFMKESASISDVFHAVLLHWHRNEKFGPTDACSWCASIDCIFQWSKSLIAVDDIQYISSLSDMLQS